MDQITELKFKIFVTFIQSYLFELLLEIEDRRESMW